MRRKYWLGALPGTRDRVPNQDYSGPAKFGFGISESKKENGSLVEHGGFDSQTRLDYPPVIILRAGFTARGASVKLEISTAFGYSKLKLEL